MKGVSEPVIKLLLDNLVKDGVLNGMESESILEENGSRADKARCLIDIVKKKGDKASSKMIVHLKSGDSSLCEKLGLSCSQPPEAGEKPEKYFY